MSRGISISIVTKGENLNYNDSIGNASELKKITRGNGDTFSYASRQALRYEIARLGYENYNWNLETVDRAQGVIQFKEECTIEDSIEMDLFGYMKTKKKKKGEEASSSEKRKGVVRITHAISLEKYNFDIDFLTNKGLADRIQEFPNISNIEQHKSFYTYTVTIDLDRVGVDGGIRLDNKERATRVIQLLEIIKVLNRDIKGSTVSLNPLFIIGGIYNICNPWFLGKIYLNVSKEGYGINTAPLEATMKSTFMGESVGENTNIGLVPGIFKNDDEISNISNKELLSIEDFFNNLEQQVKEYYGV